MSGPEVRAAGAVVWRRHGDDVEVLVVHRPRYDDWTLPKGKLDPGESEAEAARREVTEETGFTGELGPELATTAYVDHQGRAKTVRYWAMEVAGGVFEANDEVDEVRWLRPAEAVARLTHGHDAVVVERLTPHVDR